jgi:hypothetical protein
MSGGISTHLADYAMMHSTMAKVSSVISSLRKKAKRAIGTLWGSRQGTLAQCENRMESSTRHRHNARLLLIAGGDPGSPGDDSLETL